MKPMLVQIRGTEVQFLAPSEQAAAALWDALKGCRLVTSDRSMDEHDDPHVITQPITLELGFIDSQVEERSE